VGFVLEHPVAAGQLKMPPEETELAMVQEVAVDTLVIQ
jgi:hypothetical protein